VTPDERVKAAQRVAYETNDPHAWAELYQLLQRTGFVDGIEGQAALFEEWIPVLAVLGDPGAKLLLGPRCAPGGLVSMDDPNNPGREKWESLTSIFYGTNVIGSPISRFYGPVFQSLVATAWVRLMTRSGEPDHSAVGFVLGCRQPDPAFVTFLAGSLASNLTPREWCQAASIHTLPAGSFNRLDMPGELLRRAWTEARAHVERHGVDRSLLGLVALTLVKPWALAGSPRHWDPTPYLERDDFWKVRLP
jgi:hypothetical protein